jgi:hypothetical protein
MVYFDVNRNGKRYLAVDVVQQYDEGVGRWKQPHHCSPAIIPLYAAVLAEREEARAAAMANGEVVKGQTVEVFKGRKVPKGTTGIVFWVAPEEDSWGAIRVGFTTAEGEKHFTSITNVQALAKESA